jgi:hypothetical protein
MDGRPKPFAQEAVFRAARDSVLEAARGVMAGSLGPVENTADSFAAYGCRGEHARAGGDSC